MSQEGIRGLRECGKPQCLRRMAASGENGGEWGRGPSTEEGRPRELLRNRCKGDRELKCHGKGHGLLLWAVGVEESARSHLTWSPEAFPGFPLSSTLCPPGAGDRKGALAPSSPSASLSHCHPLFISPDATGPPQQGTQVLLSTPRPISATPPASGGPSEERQQAGWRAAETWQTGLGG